MKNKKGTPLWKALLFEQRLPWRYASKLEKITERWGSIPKGGKSSHILDQYIKQQIKKIQPKTVVDFGAGKGKYGRMIRNLFKNKVNITAVEIYPPSIRFIKQQKIYDNVNKSDLINWLNKNDDYYDLAIFGDVLEHLTNREIYHALDLSLKRFNNILIQCPEGIYHQGMVGGNKSEIHRTTIHKNFFDRYLILEKRIKPTKNKRKIMFVWISR